MSSVPLGTPEEVYAKVYNATALMVTWKPVQNTRESMRGKLKGYKVCLCSQLNFLYLVCREKRNESFIFLFIFFFLSLNFVTCSKLKRRHYDVMNFIEFISEIFFRTFINIRLFILITYYRLYINNDLRLKSADSLHIMENMSNAWSNKHLVAQ